MSELGPLNANKWAHIDKQMQVLHSNLALLSITQGSKSAIPPSTGNDTSRLHLCPDTKETPGRTLEGQGRGVWEDMSVLLVSLLFPNRREPAPCPRTSTSVLQGIHVHHSFTASRLVLWLFKQPHPHKRRIHIHTRASNYNTTAMRSSLVHPHYPKSHWLQKEKKHTPNTCYKLPPY